MTSHFTADGLTESAGIGLIDALPVGVCLIDEHLRVRGWNRKLTDWTGIEAGTIEGQLLTEWFPALLGAKYLMRLKGVFEYGSPAVFSSALHPHFLPLRSAQGLGEMMVQQTCVRRVSTAPQRALITIEDRTVEARQLLQLRTERQKLLQTSNQLETVNRSLTVNLAESDAYNLRLQAEIRDREKAEAELRRHAADVIRAKTRETEHTQRLEQLVQELTAARKLAEEAAQAKAEFLANMSHEIRTPMTAILGYVSVLRDESLPAADRNQAIDTVHRNGEHLLGIINDILDISKIEAGKLRIEKNPTSPKQLIEDVMASVQPRAVERGLKLESVIHAPFPELVETDAMRLRQILVNLMSNAVKFTHQGGVKVVARWAPGIFPEGSLSIDVIDSGIGISPEQMSRLFQPFSQADAGVTRQFGGTGLGLVISQRLAEMLGGMIGVTSEPNVGSRFSLQLRGLRALAQPLAPAAEVAKPRETVPEFPLTGLRILIVDDAADNQKLLAFQLKKAGGSFEIAENGQAALECIAAAASTVPFDVVLMDMQMPVLDGYAATRTLRESGDMTPVIALTAHAMAGDRDKCLQAGCDDYLTKPIDRQKLIQMIALRAQAFAALTR